MAWMLKKLTAEQRLAHAFARFDAKGYTYAIESEWQLCGVFHLAGIPMEKSCIYHVAALIKDGITTERGWWSVGGTTEQCMDKQAWELERLERVMDLRCESKRIWDLLSDDECKGR